MLPFRLIGSSIKPTTERGAASHQINQSDGAKKLTIMQELAIHSQC